MELVRVSESPKNHSEIRVRTEALMFNIGARTAPLYHGWRLGIDLPASALLGWLSWILRDSSWLLLCQSITIKDGRVLTASSLLCQNHGFHIPCCPTEDAR